MIVSHFKSTKGMICVSKLLDNVRYSPLHELSVDLYTFLTMTMIFFTNENNNNKNNNNNNNRKRD